MNSSSSCAESVPAELQPTTTENNDNKEIVDSIKHTTNNDNSKQNSIDVDVKCSNEMKMPTSSIENIGFAGTKSSDTNNNDSTSNPPKVEPEVSLLDSEDQDDEQARHLSQDSDCTTLKFNKNGKSRNTSSVDEEQQSEKKNVNGFGHSITQKLVYSNFADLAPSVTPDELTFNDDDTPSDGITINELEQFAETFLNPNYEPKKKPENNGYSDNTLSDHGDASQRYKNGLTSNCVSDQTLVSPFNENERLSTFSSELDDSCKSLDDAINFDGMTNDGENCLMNQMYPLDVPVAMLVSKAGSCSFVERSIQVLTPIKIGRAVARLRPASDNAVFDCKVLSRNHALLWYQDGKFFLRDAGSSNGTFINTVRLSITGKKSKPHEIFSGDVLQFGVEVTEKKQVHNCVIAEIRLLLPDGSEAKKPYGDNVLAFSSAQADESVVFNSESISQFDGIGGNSHTSGFYLTTSQMIELSHFIKESMHKQALIENQLESIKNLMDQARDSASQRWHSLVKEDLLMGRIEILQDKLVALSMIKNSKEPLCDFTLEDISKELTDALAEKEQFELIMKNILQKTIEEKALLAEGLNSSETTLRVKELECDNLKTTLDQNYKQLQEIVTSSEATRKELTNLSSKAKVMEQNIAEQQEREKKSELERSELIKKIELLESTPATTQSVTTVSVHTECDAPILNDSSHINRDIQLQNQENDELSSQCQELLSTLSSLVPVVDSLNRSDGMQRLSERLDEFVSRVQRMEQKITSVSGRLRKTKEDYATDLQFLTRDFNEKIHENSTLVKLNTDLSSQIDRLNDEIEKYKIDLQTLESRRPEEPTIVATTETLAPLNEKLQTLEYETKEAQTEPEKVPDLLLSGVDKTQFDKMAEIWLKLNETIEKIHRQSSKDDDNMVTVLDDNDVLQKLDTIVENNRELCHENQSLHQDVELLRDKLRVLADKNELSFFFAVTPLIIFLTALVFGFYPFLSSIMATSGV